jgi:hypothetical protein
MYAVLTYAEEIHAIGMGMYSNTPSSADKVDIKIGKFQCPHLFSTITSIPVLQSLPSLHSYDLSSIQIADILKKIFQIIEGLLLKVMFFNIFETYFNVPIEI